MKYIITAMLFGFSLSALFAWVMFMIMYIFYQNRSVDVVDIFILGIVSMIGILYSLEVKNKPNNHE